MLFFFAPLHLFNIWPTIFNKFQPVTQDKTMNISQSGPLTLHNQHWQNCCFFLSYILKYIILLRTFLTVRVSVCECSAENKMSGWKNYYFVILLCRLGTGISCPLWLCKGTGKHSRCRLCHGKCRSLFWGGPAAR